MKCPNCGFEDHIDDASFCEECGTCLINFCTNDDCEHINDGLTSTAKFCPHCGAESTFKEAGFFDKE